MVVRICASDPINDIYIIYSDELPVCTFRYVYDANAKQCLPTTGCFGFSDRNTCENVCGKKLIFLFCSIYFLDLLKKCAGLESVILLQH